MIVHRRKKDRGLVNKLLNSLPVELHIPGYQYCGPGTKLAKRLARGDSGINALDTACKEHDIVYSQNRENIEARNAADKVLANKAWGRVTAGDAGVGEKMAAYAITNAMKLKRKFGMGMKKKSTPISLKNIVKMAKKSIVSGKCAKKVIKSALKSAREAGKKAGIKQNIIIPRILPVSPKVGGFLPFLIPLFTGLSAAGALAGGAAGNAKAVNDSQTAKLQLEETQRHNRIMENGGNGLYRKPHKTGLGIHRGLKKKSSK